MNFNLTIAMYYISYLIILIYNIISSTYMFNISYKRDIRRMSYVYKLVITEYFMYDLNMNHNIYENNKK